MTAASSIAALPVRSGRRRTVALPGRRLGETTVGLTIGVSRLTAAVIAPGTGAPRLVMAARADLAPGVVVDGEVRDTGALRDAIRGFFAANGLPTREVSLGIATNRVGVRTVEIERIDDAERFDNAVRYRAHEVLPLAYDEALVGYRVIGDRVGETGAAVRRVLLVVAPRDHVEPYIRACAEAGVRLAAVELEPLALVRLFATDRPHPRTASAIAAVGDETTSIVVVTGGECSFARVLDRGGATMGLAVAPSRERDVEWSRPGRDRGALIDLPARGHAAAHALDPDRFAPLAREFVSSLDYYRAQEGALPVGELVLTGDIAEADRFAGVLERAIGVPVRVGDPLGGVEVAPALEMSLAPFDGSLAVPIALALPGRETTSVDLLPVGPRRARRRPRPLHVALPLCAALPLVGVVLLFAQAREGTLTARLQLATAQAQVALVPPAPETAQGGAVALTGQERARALARILDTRFSWDRVLDDVARVVPADVWLTEFAADAPEALPGVAAADATSSALTAIRIEGYAYTLPGVARLLDRLATVKGFTNVALAASANEPVGDGEAMAFTITAEIAAPEGPA